MNAILSIIAAIFRLLANRSEPAAVARRDREALESEKDKITTEVSTGNEDAVNARIKKLLGCVVCLLAVGCASARVVYVPIDNKVVRAERDGNPGWWVPDHIMVEMLQRLEEKK